MTEQDVDVVAYSAEVEGLERFGQMLTELVYEILRNHGIVVHAVNFRVKSEESAVSKIERKPDRYDRVGSLTDLLGLRVICYFSDQVDQVATALGAEFSIDEKNSVDKRKDLGDREFGYLSLHRIAKVLPQRGELIEYKRFGDISFEIQIRSILQHAWAEIEHDLGYKVSTIPSHLRRRFSMLAGVLELADREFISLRRDVSAYERDSETRASIDPDNLALDQSTLEAVLMKDPLFVELDERIAEAGGSGLANHVSPRVLTRRLADLDALDIHDMRSLREMITERRQHIVSFAARWLASPEHVGRRGPAPRGIGLNYMVLLLRAQLAAAGGAEEFLPGASSVEKVLDMLKTVEDELGGIPMREPRG